MSETLIRLENVSKAYPGTEAPAVGNLTMDVQEGEVLVLVGPIGLWEEHHPAADQPVD